MECHLPTSGAIDLEQGRTGKTRVLFKEAERLPILPKCGQETGILFPGKLNDAEFRDHDGPTKNRSDGEKEENDFARNRGVLEGEEQTAGRNQLRNEHFRVT
jgi:hypothetical protein